MAVRYSRNNASEGMVCDRAILFCASGETFILKIKPDGQQANRVHVNAQDDANPQTNLIMT
ncbi:hypothetical protein M2311_003639 [Rhizobium leguminosarum]|nr:hypothetical protein [Rhizobium leguminosarum]